jgi:flavin-dependent dehydrogenase
MLGSGTIDEHPELKRYPYRVSRCREIVYISPKDDRKRVPAPKPIPVISRLDLNRYLLDMAKNSGAEFIRRKVLNISPDHSRWLIESEDSAYEADLIVGADGVNSIVRKATAGKFPRRHLSLTCGYILRGVPDDQYITKFLDIAGYIWVFSRAHQASAGIGATLGTVSAKSLFKKLDDFLSENYPQSRIKEKYAALIPTPADDRFFDKPCSGDNWLLVGDAAGHVDPVVGEGIYYALGSAKAAAQAIGADDIHAYEALWRAKYGAALKQGAALRQNLSIMARDFGPEAIGALMFSRAART